jgi:hypothetical protein
MEAPTPGSSLEMKQEAGVFRYRVAVLDDEASGS